MLVNGRVAAEYAWQDMLCLLRHKDCESGLSHEFVYGPGRVPEKVILRGPAGAVQAATGIYASELVLNIWADQVESVRALSLPDGRPLKFLEYDAFGHVALDTRPEWRFPLGFACGLNDPWTGFVRFGFRDYDPRFGRFTARDPLGDTGGDHDLWEYCLDDPVNMNDPSGLIPPLLAFAAGKLLMGGLAAAGTYGAAALTDWLNPKNGQQGEKSAVRAVNRVAPTALKTMGAAAAPGALILGGVAAPGAAAFAARTTPELFAKGAAAVSGLYTGAGQRVGAELFSRGLDKPLKTAAQFAEGFFVPVSPALASKAGIVGSGTKAAMDWYRHEQNKSLK